MNQKQNLISVLVSCSLLLSGCFWQQKQPLPPLIEPAPVASNNTKQTNTLSQLIQTQQNVLCHSSDATDTAPPTYTIKISTNDFFITYLSVQAADQLRTNIIGTTETLYWWQEKSQRDVDGKKFTFSKDKVALFAEATPELAFFNQEQNFTCAPVQFTSADFTIPADISF